MFRWRYAGNQTTLDPPLGLPLLGLLTLGMSLGEILGAVLPVGPLLLGTANGTPFTLGTSFTFGTPFTLEHSNGDAG